MVLVFVISMKKVEDLLVGFIVIFLGLNWFLMFYFGGKFRWFKIWLYLFMFIMNFFCNWYYMVYGIFMVGRRMWGGLRVDVVVVDSYIIV